MYQYILYVYIFYNYNFLFYLNILIDLSETNLVLSKVCLQYISSFFLTLHFSRFFYPYSVPLFILFAPSRRTTSLCLYSSSNRFCCSPQNLFSLVEVNTIVPMIAMAFGDFSIECWIRNLRDHIIQLFFHKHVFQLNRIPFSFPKISLLEVEVRV